MELVMIAMESVARPMFLKNIKRIHHDSPNAKTPPDKPSGVKSAHIALAVHCQTEAV
jgi:hypothetical protein